MIRQLRESDRDLLVDFLTTYPTFNIYMLGNIETLGVDRDISQFWGDFGKGKEDVGFRLKCVLNRYMSGWSVFGTPNAEWRNLGKIIDEHPAGATRIQNNPVGTASILPYLHRYCAVREDVEELMTLQSRDFVPVKTRRAVVRRGTLDDLPLLVEFYLDAGDYSRSSQAVERPLRDTRLWLAEKDGVILSSALTNAEAAGLAMIGGVYTAPTHRGLGYCKAVCSALCSELLTKNKVPVLYWRTPAAGAVYRKLGFRPQGTWRSAWLKRRS